MLIRFEVKNYKSFKDSSVLPLYTNSKIRNDGKHEVEFGKMSLLKYASIYGGNATGKTNLFSALLAVKKLVIFQDAFDIKPFKDRNDNNVFFDLVFKKNKTVFRYKLGVSVGRLNNYRIIEESLSLIDLNNRNESLVFDINSIQPEYLSPNDKGVKEKLYFESCRKEPKNTFLSFFTRRENKINSSKLQDVINLAYSFIYGDLVFVTNNLDGFSQINDTSIEKISKRLCLYDTGIDKLRFQKYSDEEIRNIIPKRIMDDIHREYEKIENNAKANLTISLTNGIDIFNFISDSNGNIVGRKIVSNHKGFNSHFEYNEESDGTKRLILLSALLFGNAKNEKVYVFDEFEKSLHPNLAEAIVCDFIEENKSAESQLIITSHLPLFMDSAFRKDELFIVDKSPTGISSIYPVMRFNTKLRSDTKLSKNYFEGRFGGIPRIDRVIR